MDSLLKYTGYGNAAGLLAARGLLAGGRGDNWYSEDEDTDTEEYKNAKPKYSIKFLFTYACAFDLVIYLSLPLSFILQVFPFFCGFGSFPFNSVFRDNFIASSLESDFK